MLAYGMGKFTELHIEMDVTARKVEDRLAGPEFIDGLRVLSQDV
jgi:hypothetical protein